MDHRVHKIDVTENIFTILLETVCICVFAIHLIILICWLIQLFKSSVRLRKQLKYLTTATHRSDTGMNILNNQVDYRKTLFMFAIVLFELISSILIIISSTQLYEITINKYVLLHKHGETNQIKSGNTENSFISISSQNFSMQNKPEMTSISE